MLLLTAAVGVLALAMPAQPSPQASVGAATLSYVEGRVEIAPPGGGFTPASEGQSFPAGMRLRTAEGSLARIDFPVMTVLASSSTELAFAGDPPSLLLERGRIEITSRGSAILPVRAGDAEVRGDGWAVVRREENNLQLSAVEGRFELAAGGQNVKATSGQGALLPAGGAPRTVAFGERPRVVLPSADARYVAAGEPVELSWRPAGASHVQVLSFETDHVLVERDLEGDRTSLAIPWPGLYRWRVAARDANGVEGPPSTEGLICVMEK